MFHNEIMSSFTQFRSGLAVEPVQFFVCFRNIDTVAPAYLSGDEFVVDNTNAESEGFLEFRLTRTE